MIGVTRFAVAKETRKRFFLDFLACTATPLSSILNFARYNNYELLSPELGIVLLLLFAFGLVCAAILLVRSQLVRTFIFSAIILAFIDAQYNWLDSWNALLLAIVAATIVLSWALRRHIAILVLAVSVTTIVATLFLPSGAPYTESVAGKAEEHGQDRNLPIIVHLILDEHIGVEGMPTDIPGGAEIKSAIKDFFEDYGFRLFGGAYSRYFSTNESIADTLNFASLDAPMHHVRGSEPYILETNKYFQLMKKTGYNIRVYQAIYMDYCKETPVTLEQCYTYRHHAIRSIMSSRLTAIQRARLIVNAYVRLSFLFMETVKFYESIHDAFAEMGISLAEPSGWDGRLGPISVMQVIDQLIADVSSGSKGTLYFAHLLIPHFPYVLDADCEIRTPVATWKSRRPLTLPNTSASRAERYVLYFDQIACTLLKLRELFEALKGAGHFDGATIIVHGDHGSRIVLVEPFEVNKDSVSTRDLHDSYSTLFAAKAPSLAEGYDPEMRPISWIFREIIEGRGASSRMTERPYVQWRKKGTKLGARTPLPPFAK